MTHNHEPVDLTMTKCTGLSSIKRKDVCLREGFRVFWRTSLKVGHSNRETQHLMLQLKLSSQWILWQIHGYFFRPCNFVMVDIHLSWSKAGTASLRLLLENRITRNVHNVQCSLDCMKCRYTTDLSLSFSEVLQTCQHPSNMGKRRAGFYNSWSIRSGGCNVYFDLVIFRRKVSIWRKNL